MYLCTSEAAVPTTCTVDIMQLESLPALTADVCGNVVKQAASLMGSVQGNNSVKGIPAYFSVVFVFVHLFFLQLLWTYFAANEECLSM